MSPSQRTVLFWASAAQASNSLLNFGLPAIGPQLREEFGLSLAELGGVLTVSLLGSGVALIPAGKAVDRFGARVTTSVGSALGAAGLAAAAFAPNGLVLALFLFVGGIGLAAVPIAGMGSIFRVFDPARRGWALGVRQMAVPLGGVVGAVLLPVLDHVGGARLALLACAGTVAATGVVFAAVAGDARPPERPRAGVRRIWRTPGIPRLLLVAACYIVVLQSLLAYTVPAAREAGLSSFLAGATFFAVNVSAGVARVAWGRLADRHGGTRRVQTIVGAGWVATVGGVLFALSLHVGAAVVIPAAILFAFGALGWNALVYVVAAERAAPELAGQSVAVAATLVFVLSFAITPPMGALAEHAGWDVFWATAAALAAAGALAASRLHGSDRPAAL